LVTPDEVRAIFPTTLADGSLVAFIDAGLSIINEAFTGSDYSESRLKQIALFFIAHLAATASPRMESEDFSGYKYKVTGKFGEGLRSTSYGQAALTLDTDGVLESLGKQRARISAFDIRSR